MITRKFTAPLLMDWLLDVEQDPPEAWLIENFILADSAIQITGPATKGKKTFFAFALALCVASGKPWCGLKPNIKAPVLIIETEGPRRSTAKRFAMFKKSMQLEFSECAPMYFLHRKELYLDHPKTMNAVAEFVQEHGIKLIVIDTLAKSMTGDENTVQDISRAMSGIDKLREHGAAVIYLHHVGKPTEAHSDIDHQTRGSSALAGFYDLHLAIRCPEGDAPHLNLTRRSNEAKETYYTMLWNIDDDNISLDLQPTANLSALNDTQKDSCVHRLSDAELYSQTALRAIWNLSAEATHTMLNNLLSEGTLEKVGRYKYRLK